MKYNELENYMVFKNNQYPLYYVIIKKGGRVFSLGIDHDMFLQDMTEDDWESYFKDDEVILPTEENIKDLKQIITFIFNITDYSDNT